MVSVGLMNSRLRVLIGLVVAVGLAVAALWHFTRPQAGVQSVRHGDVSRRTFVPPPTEVGARDAGSLAVESPQRGAARERYDHLLEAIRGAAHDRQVADPAPAPEAPSGDEVDQRAATAYSPDEMPVPGTRTSDAPIPSPEEQHRFFAALTDRADPLVDQCYRSLPEPRPRGTLKLVWTTLYDHDVGTVVERIELDQTSEGREPPPKGGGFTCRLKPAKGPEPHDAGHGPSPLPGSRHPQAGADLGSPRTPRSPRR